MKLFVIGATGRTGREIVEQWIDAQGSLKKHFGVRCASFRTPRGSEGSAPRSRGGF